MAFSRWTRCWNYFQAVSSLELSIVLCVVCMSSAWIRFASYFTSFMIVGVSFLLGMVVGGKVRKKSIIFSSQQRRSFHSRFNTTTPPDSSQQWQRNPSHLGNFIITFHMENEEESERATHSATVEKQSFAASWALETPHLIANEYVNKILNHSFFKYCMWLAIKTSTEWFMDMKIR